MPKKTKLYTKKPWWPKELRNPQTLSKLELQSIVREIQRRLWVDEPYRGKPRFNPDKNWEGADTLGEIAHVLEIFDLSPRAD
jgi:hypothetical protein